MEEKVEIKSADAAEPSHLLMSVGSHRQYRLVFLALWIIESLLAFRFLLKLFGANPRSFFAIFVYGISAVFIFPFNGLFPSAESASPDVHKIFDPGILIAMLVYVVVAWIAGKAILIMRGKPTGRAE